MAHVSLSMLLCQQPLVERDCNLLVGTLAQLKYCENFSSSMYLSAVATGAVLPTSSSWQLGM